VIRKVPGGRVRSSSAPSGLSRTPLIPYHSAARAATPGWRATAVLRSRLFLRQPAAPTCRPIHRFPRAGVSASGGSAKPEQPVGDRYAHRETTLDESGGRPTPIRSFWHTASFVTGSSKGCNVHKRMVGNGLGAQYGNPGDK